MARQLGLEPARVFSYVQANTGSLSWLATAIE